MDKRKIFVRGSSNSYRSFGVPLTKDDLERLNLTDPKGVELIAMPMDNGLELLRKQPNLEELLDAFDRTIIRDVKLWIHYDHNASDPMYGNLIVEILSLLVWDYYARILKKREDLTGMQFWLLETCGQSLLPTVDNLDVLNNPTLFRTKAC